jgi:transposase-like protein
MGQRRFKIMPRGVPATSPEIKAEVLKKIKDEGQKVPELAKQYGISTQTIYHWIAKGVNSPPSILEVARLKREIATLHEIIGRITVKLSLSEKKETDR